MASLILKMGHPLLRCESLEVEQFNCPELFSLAKQLLKVQAEYAGAGLSAPQLGFNQRVICFGGKTPRYADSEATAPIVLINPELFPQGKEMVEGWEGCLSVPGLRGLVARYETVEYRGFDIFGKKICGVVSGFLARALQHECDHLDGILFPDRIQDLKHFGYEEAMTVSPMAL